MAVTVLINLTRTCYSLVELIILVGSILTVHGTPTAGNGHKSRYW